MSGHRVTFISPMTSSSSAGQSASPAQSGGGGRRPQSTFFALRGASGVIKSEGESDHEADDKASPILQASTISHRSWLSAVRSQDEQGELLDGEQRHTGAGLRNFTAAEVTGSPAAGFGRVTPAKVTEPPDQIQERPASNASPEMARATPGSMQGQMQSGNDTPPLRPVGVESYAGREAAEERTGDRGHPANTTSPEMARATPGGTRQGRMQSGNNTPPTRLVEVEVGAGRETVKDGTDDRGHPANNTIPGIARATPQGTRQGPIQSGKDAPPVRLVQVKSGAGRVKERTEDQGHPANRTSAEIARATPGASPLGPMQSGSDTPPVRLVEVERAAVREVAEESADVRGGEIDGKREPSEAVPLKMPLPLPEAKTLLQAVQNGVPEVVATMLKTMDEAQVFEELPQTTLVLAATESGDDELCTMVLDAMLENIPVREGLRDRKSLAALSLLLEQGAKPDPLDLVLLSRTVKSELLEDCFVQAVSTAGNPFIPSLNISFGLDRAIGIARDMERKVLTQLRHGVNRLLAETLRWLPQTVRDLPGGMAACTALFEPELTSMHSVDGSEGSGPLAVALKCSTRVVTFATTPLAMDYMFQKFSRGLPGLLDTGRVTVMEVPLADTREEGKWHDSLTAYTQGSMLGTVMSALGKSLGCDSLCGLTLLPGAHFIAMGMVSVTNSYYKTPVIRMVFDLIVYASVLALFTAKVLCHNNGSIGGSEIAFIVWVVAAFAVEIGEMRRDLEEYLLDRWNVFDLSALSLSLAGFVVRAVDHENAWGRSLYALAAPLLYWRLLFYAQLLPFQGAMIQVIFSMSSELVQFGIVMGVVMVGFAIAFFALVREIDDSTFRESLLNVFVAMLGEVSLFDEFTGTRYDAVGKLLLATYLIIMSIMLLNLLVAVLSTSHAKLEGNVLIRVSRARLFMAYRWVVADDVLPAPFNLLQLAAFLPFGAFDLLGHYPSVRQALGRVAFWLVMGPVAIVIGSLLWLVSLPRSLVVIWRDTRATSIVCRVGKLLLCVAWTIVGVPVCLTTSWLAQVASVVMGKTGILESSTPPGRVKVSIEKMLKESTSGLGMADVRMSLMDPVSSPPYYFNREAHDRSATVGDVQLLRKRLEGRIDEVRGAMEKKGGAAAVEERLQLGRVDKLEEKLDLILSMLSTQRNSSAALQKQK